MSACSSSSDPEATPSQAPPPPDALLNDNTADSGIAGSFASNTVEGANLRSGQVWADFTGDGLQDLYLTTVSGPNLLYDNMGDGKFAGSTFAEDVSLIDAQSGSASAPDYDNDGLADLFVLTDSGPRLFHSEGKNGFTETTDSVLSGDLSKTTAAAWADWNGDGYTDLAIGDSVGGPVLLRNDAGTKLIPTGSIESGLPGTASGTINAVAFFDADGDFDNDLYVVYASDTSKNALYRNDDGLWPNVAADAGADLDGGALSVTVADIDNNAAADLLIAGPKGLTLLSASADGNTFTNSTKTAGLEYPESLWDVVAVDINDDGLLDVYAAGIGDNLVFLGKSTGSFDSPYSVTGNNESRGVATASVFGTGRADFVIANVGSDNQTYKNATTSGARLQVSVTGSGPVATDAIGTRITITPSGSSDPNSTQTVFAGFGPATGTGNSLVQHVGLGSATSVDIDVQWPDGTKASFTNVAVDVSWSLTYGGQPATASF